MISFNDIARGDGPEILPEPPVFTEEELHRAKKSGDYKPILFEWYKFVASLGVVLVNMLPECPAFRQVPSQHYNVLMGLLNRCHRLMLSNMALSHEGKFGETTAIIDRCIFESAIKITWLCNNHPDDKFVRYMATGLKTELEFKSIIENTIKARSEGALPFELRMLTSIRNHILASGLSEEEIISTKKIPNIDAIITELGYNHLLYIVAQRLGSHHIHGNWPSLLFHYLEESEDGERFKFKPRGHDCDTHINQYMFVPLIVLNAMTSYVQYVLEDGEAQVFSDLFESTEQEILRAYNEAGEDAR